MSKSSRIPLALTMAAALGGGMTLGPSDEPKKKKIPMTEEELELVRSLPRKEREKKMKELRAKYIAEGWVP